MLQEAVIVGKIELDLFAVARLVDEGRRGPEKRLALHALVLVHVQKERDTVLATLAHVLALVIAVHVVDDEHAFVASLHGAVFAWRGRVYQVLVLEPIHLHIVLLHLASKLGH